MVTWKEKAQAGWMKRLPVLWGNTSLYLKHGFRVKHHMCLCLKDWRQFQHTRLRELAWEGKLVLPSHKP